MANILIIDDDGVYADMTRQRLERAGHHVVVHEGPFGATAAAKLLFVLRPRTVTAWDLAISRRPGVDGDFSAHLRDARRLATQWTREATGRSVPDVVGRPTSTLAKIVDEVLYLTCTRGISVSSPPTGTGGEASASRVPVGPCDAARP